MQVLRLENREGKGVYRVCGPDELPVDYEKHPTPELDGLLAPQWCSVPVDCIQKWYFGFADIEQLRRWFYNDDLLKSVSTCGVGLSVYEVDEQLVMRGYTQCVFHIKEARLVRHWESALEGVEEFENGTV